MGLSALTLLGLLWAPGQVPSDVTAWNSPSMKIPIDYHPSKRNEIRELMLYVSPDQGQTWQQYVVGTPDKDTHFTFNAQADGVYWFNMVVVDKAGRREPPDLYKAAPALKVLFDTKKPVVSMTKAEREGNDVVVGWKILENNPDWSKFKIEYSTNGREWINVSVRAEKEGTQKFSVGSAGAVTVRMSVSDVVGQVGEASKEVPAVVLAKSPAPMMAEIPAVGGGMSDLIAGPDRRVPRLMTEPTGMDTPPSMNTTFPPAPGSPGAPMLPPVEAPAPMNVVAPPPTPAVTPKMEVGVSTPILNLPPAQVINLTSFKMAYEVEDKGPSGVGKAEVWITRDDGKTWRQWSVHEKPESPLLIEVNKNSNPTIEGIYGIKVVLFSGAGLARETPKSGEAPDLRVDVDVTPPIVKIYEPVPDNTQKDTMILRWQAVDRNLATDPITLEWADNPRGPWIPIATSDTIGASGGVAKRLANTGTYAWKLPANFPTHRVYLKVTARDVAGNVSEATTAQPILVDLNKPSALKLNVVGGGNSPR